MELTLPTYLVTLPSSFFAKLHFNWISISQMMAFFDFETSYVCRCCCCWTSRNILHQNIHHSFTSSLSTFAWNSPTTLSLSFSPFHHLPRAQSLSLAFLFSLYSALSLLLLYLSFLLLYIYISFSFIIDLSIPFHGFSAFFYLFHSLFF